MNETVQTLSGWFDLTRLLAVAGVLISITSLYFTWQNRTLALAQERRRIPKLKPTLVQGYYLNQDEICGRLYAFRVTVTNPSDSNNAIAAAELSITYLNADRVPIVMKLGANVAAAKPVPKDQEQTLPVPAMISAHGAVSGWLWFHAPTAMLFNRDIETYRLTLTDAHGETTDVIPILVSEQRNEAQL